MRLFFLESDTKVSSIPQLPYFSPSPRIFVTHFASLWVPFDAPGVGSDGSGSYSLILQKLI